MSAKWFVLVAGLPGRRLCLPYGCGLIYRRWSWWRGAEVFIDDPRFAAKLAELADRLQEMANCIERVAEAQGRVYYFLRKWMRSAANRRGAP